MPSTKPGLREILIGTVTRHNMIVAGQTVVVGASGGPDSTALLHALAQLRDEWRLSLVACHLNHNFRGEEAQGDAAYVRALCESLNVPCRIESIDVPALQKRRHWSAQQAARTARHAFLRRVADEVGAKRIALAHTRNDRTETVLLNLLRGTGLEGLTGFPPVALPLIRPFYEVTRSQVEHYCEHFQLSPRHDSSNMKLTYRRNRVRLELLPQLRTAYNPRVDDALLRLADLAAEDNALLETLAAQFLETLLLFSGSPSVDTLLLSLNDFNALPVSLRRRVLRQAIARIRNDLQNVTLEAIETVLGRAARGQEGSVELPADAQGTVRVHCDSIAITIMRVTPPSVSVPWKCSIAVPSQTLAPSRNVLVIARTCLPAELPNALAELREQWPENIVNGQLILWPAASVQLPLMMRSWKPGDRMRPRGLNGTKKIQDIFTDLKIPAEERASIPLLAEEASGRVLAVGKWRVEETALFACRLSSAKSRADTIFEEAQGKVAASGELRELLAVLFLYQ